MHLTNLDSLQALSTKLNSANITHALGGSALLYALGIQTDVNDWDITTDSSLKDLKEALEEYDFIVGESNETFASDYIVRLEPPHYPTDIIGNFSINTKKKPIKIETIITDYWQGIPLGSPEEWHKAYTAMKRESKAALLATYLNQSS